MQILADAANMHFKEIGQGGNPAAMMQLIMEKDKPVGYDNGTKSIEEHKKFLTNAAPHIGKDGALVLITDPDQSAGAAMTGGGHAFTVVNIDTQTGQVAYVNPWDSSKLHYATIDDMAKKMAEKDTGTLFEYMQFS